MPPDQHRGRAAWIQTLIMATMMAPKLRSQPDDNKENDEDEDDTININAAELKKRAKTVFKRNKLPGLKAEEGRNDPSPQAIQKWFTELLGKSLMGKTKT